MANEEKHDEQTQAEAPEAEQPEESTEQAEAPEGEESIDSLKARIESLSGAMEAAKEQVLRSQAEAQNARRRAEQDVAKAHKFGQEKLVQDLLPVVDNLERAMASMNGENPDTKAVIEGIELTHKAFVDVLAKHQIEAIDPQGEPFDPERHQAMTMVENPDVEPNTVLEVFQKGYTLSGRLVRPAMVVVAKGE